MIPNHSSSKTAKKASTAGRSESTSPTGVVEALSHLRTRSPEEMLGVNAGSGLGRSFLQATAGTVVLFLALTIIPFYVDKADRQNAANNAAPPVPSENKETISTPTPATTTATEPEAVVKKTPGPATEPEKGPKKKNIIDVLGESGTKTGKPGVNPLDRKDEDLFKD